MLKGALFFREPKFPESNAQYYYFVSQSRVLRPGLGNAILDCIYWSSDL